MTAETLTAGDCLACHGRGAVYRSWLAREGTCPSCQGSGRAPDRPDDDPVNVTISLDEAAHATP